MRDVTLGKSKLSLPPASEVVVWEVAVLVWSPSTPKVATSGARVVAVVPLMKISPTRGSVCRIRKGCQLGCGLHLLQNGRREC